MKTKAFAALALTLVAGSLFALEISSEASLGNMAFDTGRSTALSAPLNGEAFAETWAYGGSISATENIGDAIYFSAGIERDPTIRNLVFTRVGFDAGFAKLAVGPFFGPFNTDGSVLTSGLSTTLRLEFAGLVFGSFRSDSTIGAGLAAPGDYVQERSEVTVGLWVPNVVVSVRLGSDSFTWKKASDLTIVDERTRYEFLADAYKKNIPYTVGVNFAYENLKRSYVGATSADSLTDELGSALIGMKLAFQVTDHLRISAGGEAALYAWGIGDLRSPPVNSALFNANLGVTLTFPSRTAGITESGGE